MHPFIFFKAQGGPLKEADLAKKKNLQRETETQFETLSQTRELLKTQKMSSHLQRAA